MPADVVAGRVGSESIRLARTLPTWFVCGLTGLVAWCAAGGAVGILLLIPGWYSPGLVAAVATLVSIAAVLVTKRAIGTRAHADHVPALVAVGLVVVFFVVAGAFHSEHLLRDRDPAVYIATGRVIARTHQLSPLTHVGPFRARMFGDRNGRYVPNFFPMLPVLLALGWSAGGDTALLLVGPLLGALGLLAIYALATRVVGTRVALLVPLLLMIAPFQLWFGRDAYSELVVQVVVAGGLWLFLETRARTSWGVALLSGLLVATSALARIDALTIIVGVVLLIAVEWTRADSDPNPTRARRFVATFAGALIVGVLIAIGATHHTARGYVQDLGTEYKELLAAFAAAVIGLGAVVVLHRVRPGIGRWFASKRAFFVGAVVAATGVVVWAYVWRPEPTRDLPVVAAGHAPTLVVRKAIYAWHFSRSLHWFSAYFGVIGIVVAFVGFVILATRSRRGSIGAAAAFLVVVPVAILYIARPSITPDQPWVMRRYLPVVIPGIAIAIVVAFEAGWRIARSARQSIAKSVLSVGVAAVAVLVVVPTAAAALPFARARMQHGAQAAVQHVCDHARDDSAILVYNGSFLSDLLPETLYAFCGVPVATLVYGDPDPVLIAQQWHALGKRFLIATPNPALVTGRTPGATLLGHYVVPDDQDPEHVFDHAPRRFAPVPLQFWLYEIPTVAK